MGMASGNPTNLIWLANPMLWMAWLLMACAKARGATVFALAALVVGGAFYFRSEVVRGESGIASLIGEIGPAYAFWLASMVLVVAGCGWREDEPNQSLQRNAGEARSADEALPPCG
jgi:hypothetical protein